MKLFLFFYTKKHNSELDHLFILEPVKINSLVDVLTVYNQLNKKAKLKTTILNLKPFVAKNKQVSDKTIFCNF